MKVLLLSNQPEKTTRLKLFAETLRELGFSVIVPSFKIKNWISIATKAKNLIEMERPDVVHIFNVPDIIYRKIPALKGEYYKWLIYDYRSPWGLEYRMNFGPLAQWIAEGCEKVLAVNADLITTVNTPLSEKVKKYLDNISTPVYTVPNYPKRNFSQCTLSNGDIQKETINPIVLFLGRVCTQEGIQNFIKLSHNFPDYQFWIVGDGPFSWWYHLNKPKNLKFWGWQPHNEVVNFIIKANICTIPRKENRITQYSNDKSIWKLNEYLNLGKIVVASGISCEEKRKNLVITKPNLLPMAIKENIYNRPEPLKHEDYRFWENNFDIIKNIYGSL